MIGDATIVNIATSKNASVKTPKLWGIVAKTNIITNSVRDIMIVIRMTICFTVKIDIIFSSNHPKFHYKLLAYYIDRETHSRQTAFLNII